MNSQIQRTQIKNIELSSGIHNTALQDASRSIEVQRHGHPGGDGEHGQEQSWELCGVSHCQSKGYTS